MNVEKENMQRVGVPEDDVRDAIIRWRQMLQPLKGAAK